MHKSSGHALVAAITIFVPGFVPGFVPSFVTCLVFGLVFGLVPGSSMAQTGSGYMSEQHRNSVSAEVDGKLQALQDDFTAADTAANEGIAQYQDGRYVAACSNFRFAAAKYRSIAYDAREIARDYLREVDHRVLYGKAEDAENDANTVEGYGTTACYAAESGGSAPSDYSTPSQDSGDGATLIDDLRTALDAGVSANKDAYNQYQNDQFSEACESAKRSTAAYANAQVLAQAVLGRWPGHSIDMEHLDQNARQAAADEAEFYCAP